MLIWIALVSLGSWASKVCHHDARASTIKSLVVYALPKRRLS